MTETTHREECNAVSTVLVAFELGAKWWKLALTTSIAQVPRTRRVEAGDLVSVFEWVGRTRQVLRVPADAPLVTCYEAGRDGFWLHRALREHGIRNQVIDAASIETPRRRRHAKTDRIDAEKLVILLARWMAGERRALRIVQVPSEADEDARELHRELESVKRMRVAVGNRIVGLMAKHGVRVEVTPTFGRRLVEARRWDGSPIPPSSLARIERDWQEYETLTARIRLLETDRSRQLREATTPAVQQVRQLMELGAVGENSAWLFVYEFFAWRAFRNRRQLGALAGMTPTPYSSGDREREQGMSGAGNRRVRTMAIEIAWSWLRFQPQSALARWYRRRFGGGSRRQRRIGIVALARKLLIALWQYLEAGALPEGARLKAAQA